MATYKSAVTSSAYVYVKRMMFLSHLQFEGSESLSSTNLSQMPRPSSDLNNSSSQSPAHSKVQRSISATQKQRRYSDHGQHAHTHAHTHLNSVYDYV